MLPSFGSYGQYSSGNYGVNSMYIRVGNITIYYSYKTIVAYEDNEDGLVVNENDWSVTTGKHLNWIDGGAKSERIPREQFMSKLNRALGRALRPLTS